MAYYEKIKFQHSNLLPVNVIFRFLQTRSKLRIWLDGIDYLQLEGFLIGFDEHMNLVMDDAQECYVNEKKNRKIGRILLKGNNITLIHTVE